MIAAKFTRISRVRLVLWTMIAAFLLAPLIAMQFTHEVVWTARDFGLAFILLAVPALVWEWAQARVRNRSIKNAIAASLIFAVLLIWVEGAVGIFH